MNASATVEDKDTFRTPFGKSLICDRGTNITYKRTDSQITLRLYDVKLQAFDAGKDFSDGKLYISAFFVTFAASLHLNHPIPIHSKPKR